MGRWRRRRRRGQSSRKTPPHVIENVAGQLLPMKWGGGAEGAGGARAVENSSPCNGELRRSRRRGFYQKRATPPHVMGGWRRSRRRGFRLAPAWRGEGA